MKTSLGLRTGISAPTARQDRPAVQAFRQMLAEPSTKELLASHGFRRP